jgi:hypothetical protein
MLCEWCGNFGAQRVTAHPTVVVRCNEQSPFDPRIRCRKAKGHLSACKGDAPVDPLYLCGRCFGVWSETGERPPAFRIAATPQQVANTVGSRRIDPRTLG